MFTNSPRIDDKQCLARQFVRQWDPFSRVGRELLQRLSVYESLSFDELVLLGDNDYRTALLLLDSLIEQGLASVDQGRVSARARPAGASLEPIRVAKEADQRLRQCRPQSWPQFDEFWSTSPVEPCTLLGQRGVTRETVAAKAYEMIANGDVQGKRILLLGDNDYLSIALALFGGPAQVTVIELDRRVIDVIRRGCDRLNLQVVAVRHDLFDPLPQALRQRYDVVIFDPQPTADNLFERMFLARAMEAISVEPFSIIYTFVAPTHKWTQFGIGFQKLVTSLNMVVVGLAPRMCEYVALHGELTPFEEDTLAMLRWREGGVSHTKSIMRLRCDNPIAVQGTPDPNEIRLQWLEKVSAHDLVHSIGHLNQARVFLEATLGYGGAQDTRLKDDAAALPIARFVSALCSSSFSERDALVLLRGDRDRLVQLSEANGYGVTDADLDTLLTVGTGGIVKLRSASHWTNRHNQHLYCVVRALNSYFRESTA